MSALSSGLLKSVHQSAGTSAPETSCWVVPCASMLGAAALVSKCDAAGAVGGRKSGPTAQPPSAAHTAIRIRRLLTTDVHIDQLPRIQIQRLGVLETKHHWQHPQVHPLIARIGQFNFWRHEGLDADRKS